MSSRKDLGRMQAELEDLIADLWQVPGFAGMRRGFRPHVDCYRMEDPPALVVVVDLAGVDPNAVEIVVDGNVLVLRGVRRRPSPECRVSYQQIEIDYGTFERALKLTEEVDSAQSTATYENGMLTITLPVARKAVSERTSIPVKGER